MHAVYRQRFLDGDNRREKNDQPAQVRIRLYRQSFGDGQERLDEAPTERQRGRRVEDVSKQIFAALGHESRNSGKGGVLSLPTLHIEFLKSVIDHPGVRVLLKFLDDAP